MVDFLNQQDAYKIMNRKWDERFLDLAATIGTWSKDPSSGIGSIIVDPESKRILSTGYNGFPSGIDDSEERLYNRELKYKYIVHGEMNAIYNATHNGISLKGSTIYVTGQPICSKCALGIISVGIKKVVIRKTGTWRDTWVEDWNFSKQLFEESGVQYEVY